MVEWINFIVRNLICPIVVTLITIYIKNKLDNRKQIKENFYHKFYDLYIESHNGRAYNYTDLPIKIQKKFLKLINENDKYVKGVLKELFYSFRSNIPMEEEDKLEEQTVNRIFNEITDYVFKQFKCSFKVNAIKRKQLNSYYKKRRKNNENYQEIFIIKQIQKDGSILYN